MALITATLEDDQFDFEKFSVDYVNGKRYTFHIRDITNREYDDLLSKPSAEAIAGLCDLITCIDQKDVDNEEVWPDRIEAGDLPHAIVANYLRLHTTFLRRLGTSLIS